MVYFVHCSAPPKYGSPPPQLQGLLWTQVPALHKELAGPEGVECCILSYFDVKNMS